jgi:alanyl-tRNA synthetase
MNARIIRQKFLDFFSEKGHQIVASAPIVVKDDPTLMFTNAGMNPFKDYFLGNKKPIKPRVADTQKCLRVSGKHNDLEEVGIDTYHHTMFEMLGNWSFGDYFKTEAIQWAWELLTRVYHLPEDRMYATVFGGDVQEALAADEEARAIWKKILPEERILDGSKKDNFWEMGDTGPCGPCSEIHIDLRPAEEVSQSPGRELVNTDHPLVIEIWNLVFIQFNRKANGQLENLPQKHIDTGMGFERLAMAVQGKTSNYDTDVFQPLIQALTGIAGVAYGQQEQTDIAVRVIVDHVRAVAFTIADGQLPSNTGAGYVIRRILRRAVRYGFTYLHFNEPFIYKLLPALCEQFHQVFPELQKQQDFVASVIREEEQSFLRTLENGIKIFDEAYRQAHSANAASGSGPVIPGEVAFKLYDTYGFPIDLTQLLARERNATVDMASFTTAMQEQKNRSKAAATQQKGDWTTIAPGAGRFVGYDVLHCKSGMLRFRELKEKKKTVYQLVLEESPFYAESGGQVGDTGHLSANGETIQITDTQKENDLIVLFADKLPTDPTAVFTCVVDADRRRRIESNHSCTHLLHAALRQVLGNHVQQRGSLVSADALRFDFSHFAKVTDEQLLEVERIVNRRIRENIARDEKRNVPIAEAKALGAMALFGEKYGEYVRVITFEPDYSVELCGGTHVQRTGSIGYCKIVSESSVAAGVRRIEAITADAAEAYIDFELNTLQSVREQLNNPQDLVKAIKGLMVEKAQLAREIEQVQKKQAGDLKQELLKKQHSANGTNAIVAKVQLPNSDVLRAIAFELKNEVDNLILILAADIDGKPQIAVAIHDQLIKSRGLHAGQLVKELAAEIKGGGGGQPFFAMAGGKDISGLDRVVIKAKDFVENIDKS